ncbi:secondary thiamine-phosphate synthase enzyme YjbQ [Mesorhizobium sp. GR13]|uniref:secondary thiamine-phosphate synthase enzyme YjbQ n=1 Tax=Mesorhizobium sp. GR13 TaxID=2562308 RepID=UPI0010C0A17A|nr:secondary thiamine-phosphate synthase enzyme YjbQ [Mesorhizobium sp. GR13]
MKSIVKRIGIETVQDIEVINITDTVKETVAASGVRDGIVYITTMHTTSGITVNEGLPDVEADLVSMLTRLAPEFGDYQHQRFLPSDGQMAVNSCSHQRSLLAGMQVAFPIENGALVMGSRQTIYFAEFDGPLYREFVIHTLGL